MESVRHCFCRNRNFGTTDCLFLRYIEMSLRIATSLATRRVVCRSIQRRSVITVPKLGTEEEMKQQAIEQIRARVQYQKELIKAQTHGHDDVSETWRWINIFFWVGIPVCFVSAVYSYFFDVHPHRFEGELPEYMKVRNKEFPWECGDCDLLDRACWKKCREEKKAK